MNREGLFRDAVVQAQRGSWLGSIRIAAPPSLFALSLLVGTLATAVGLFLALGQYTRRERVSGQLVPNSGILAVTSISPGTVTQVLVREGQQVRHNDALVEISGELDSSTMGGTRALISTQLHAQHDKLVTDLQAQQHLILEEQAGLRAKITTLQKQIEEIDGQIMLKQRQAERTEQLLAKLQPLRTKGYVSEMQIEQQRASALQLQYDVKTLIRQRLDAKQAMDDAKQQLDQLPLDLAAKQSEIQRALADNAQKLAQNEVQRAAVLRAPVDGMVSTLLAKPGQSVAADQPLLSIVPRGSILEAQLLVPSRAIGFIEPGNRVVLRYQAFPYQKFGQYYGHVLEVSRSALSNGEAASLLGQSVPGPLYRVLVRLDHQAVIAYGEPEPLKPGMALEADILLDTRSLWQWAFEPLYGLRQQLATRTKAHADG